MKLVKVLEELNSFEKTSFLNIVTDIISNESTKNKKAIDKILSQGIGQLKNVDNVNIAQVFGLIKAEYALYIKENLIHYNPQLDFLIDILLRDGNCLMSREWFLRLYEKELKNIKSKIKTYKKEIEQGDNLDPRIRDFKVYLNCVNRAYFNDEDNNIAPKITADEHTILLTLAKSLGLSLEEKRIINFLILPLEKIEIDDLIKELKDLGIIFYSKKTNKLYIPDEFVKIFRQMRGKEIADKYFRRVLNHLKDSQINLICKAHDIDKKLKREDKIKEVINVGADFKEVLLNKIFKSEAKISERKAYINNLIEKELGIQLEQKGSTNEEKVDNLIKFYNQVEEDTKITIAVDGYEQLLRDLKQILPKLNKIVKDEFELQEEDVLKSKLLIDYNIMPKDVLYVVNETDLKKFVIKKGIKQRGDFIENIIEAYKDTKNIFFENYDLIANRDYSALKENGISIKDAEIGVKFEEITKELFKELGFNVSNELKKKISDKKNKVDLVLDLGKNEIIIVECKTSKDSNYNKFSSVSRQMKSYFKNARDAGYSVQKNLLIAHDFSSDFIEECNIQVDIDLSLIKAESLKEILNAFKESKEKKFPYMLFMKDVLIDENRVVKAISK